MRALSTLIFADLYSNLYILVLTPLTRRIPQSSIYERNPLKNKNTIISYIFLLSVLRHSRVSPECFVNVLMILIIILNFSRMFWVNCVTAGCYFLIEEASCVKPCTENNLVKSAKRYKDAGKLTQWPVVDQGQWLCHLISVKLACYKLSHNR